MNKFNKKLKVQFILVDDNRIWAESFIQRVDEEKTAIIRPFGIDELEVIYVGESDKVEQDPADEGKIKNVADGLIDIISDPVMSSDCQGIILDWVLNEIDENQKLPLIRKIKAIRKELPIYLITNTRDGYKIANETKGLIDDFFYKPDVEADVVDIIKRIIAHYNRRRTSPFWKAYKSYIDEATDAWHTPGHFGGASFRSSQYIHDFHTHFGDGTFKGDLSVSVDKLGSLLDSTEYVELAQRKAASVFGASQTFFVTNGSSTANKIIIQTVLRPNDEVIVDRNCHKSVHYGIIQSGAKPHFLTSQYDSELGIFAPPSFKHIEEKVLSNPNAKLLILTGCTYDGILTDLKPVVELCHNHGLKVMVDEAWFAYSRFHPDYNAYSAVEAGADYVTHSSHKTLSAFSQASMIHVNDPDFDEHYFREIFYIYMSTSPQYQIIASLDVASTQMLMEGYKMLSEALFMAEGFRNRIKKDLQKFKLVDEEAFYNKFNHLLTDQSGFDKLKVLIDFSATGIKGTELIQLIREMAGLEIEKSTHSTFLVLFTIGTKLDKVNRLYMALKEIDEREMGDYVAKIEKQVIPKISLTENPFSVFVGSRKAIDYKEAVGKISAGLVTPYPPGIPFLMPGQKIEQAHIDYIKLVLKPNDTEVHGLFGDKVYVKED